MDPLIPEKRYDALQESIDSWGSMLKDVMETYRNILIVMDEIDQNTKNYPEESVKLLQKAMKDLERIEQKMVYMAIRCPINRIEKNSILKNVGTFLSWVAATAVGVIAGLAISGHF